MDPVPSMPKCSHCFRCKIQTPCSVSLACVAGLAAWPATSPVPVTGLSYSIKCFKLFARAAPYSWKYISQHTYTVIILFISFLADGEVREFCFGHRCVNKYERLEIVRDSTYDKRQWRKCQRNAKITFLLKLVALLLKLSANEEFYHSWNTNEFSSRI